MLKRCMAKGMIRDFKTVLHFVKFSIKNFSLPEWANKIMTPKGGDAKYMEWYRDFEYIALEWYRMYTYSPETKMLKSGFLLKEILDRFSDKIQSKLTPDRVLWMYFAHDFTISSLLNALNLFEVMIFFKYTFSANIFHEENLKFYISVTSTSFCIVFILRVVQSR